MSEDRIRRAERIIAMRTRVVEHAQARLAQAMDDSRDAEREVRTLEAAWHEHARSMQEPRTLAAADLQAAYGHVRALRLRADEAVRRWELAQDNEIERRRDLSDARLILRKFEVWRDRLVALRADDERRAQLRLDDELAARTVRSAS